MKTKASQMRRKSRTTDTIASDCCRCLVGFAAALAILTDCSNTLAPGSVGSDGQPRAAGVSLQRPLRTGTIEHIVVIVQENRTVDNLFNGLPGANTVQSGKNMRGEEIGLQPVSLTAPYDLSHGHSGWVADYDHGKMDGFSTEHENCNGKGDCPKRDVAAYGYVPRSEIKPYWDMALKYTFADNMFQTNQGPSFPAHQYLISGTSTIDNISHLKAAENPTDPRREGRQGGCNSVRGATVVTIDQRGVEGRAVYPCFDRISIMDLMNQREVSWHYYQEYGGSGLWHAVDAIKTIQEGPSYENVRWPSAQVLKDIALDRLADVTFVTPSAAESDHAGTNNGTGPSWVASIVNAIGKSSYWNNTAIIVTWDDWGGWYDHVPPQIYNSYELGFRVPMIVISPYAKRGYVSHTPYEFGSILKFIEQTFDLRSLGATDVRANDLSDCFDFGAKPRAFSLIASKYPAGYFEALPISYESPDDDN
jgi:phospholipase C